MHFSSHKVNKKPKFWKFSFFFQFLQNFERTFTVLGGNVLGRDIKIENCTLSLQSMMLRMKTIFKSFVSFPFIRTWNKNFLDLWLQNFLPGCRNCTLRVYLNPFEMLAWDVKQYKQKLFLKFGGKYSTCLFKLQSTCPKEHFE